MAFTQFDTGDEDGMAEAQGLIDGVAGAAEAPTLT